MKMSGMRYKMNVRALSSNNKTYTHLKNLIIKKNHIDKILAFDTKLDVAKQNIPYPEIIERIQTCNDTIIHDLASLSRYIQCSYTTPESRIYIRSTIYKYLDEFKNEPDVLEMFYYIYYTLS
jgi:hypothetical protein